MFIQEHQEGLICFIAESRDVVTIYLSPDLGTTQPKGCIV